MDWAETARFPQKLDRAGIVSRIAELCQWARSEGFDELATLFALPADVSVAQIGSRVLSALALVDGKPEHLFVARQLQILALNLKNLR